MARRPSSKLPDPRQTVPSKLPSDRGGTYASVTRVSDRYLAKAEEAIRMASLLWADVDSGLETTFDELAEHVLRERRAAVDMVQDLYGDRLSESAA